MRPSSGELKQILPFPWETQLGAIIRISIQPPCNEENHKYLIFQRKNSKNLNDWLSARN